VKVTNLKPSEFGFKKYLTRGNSFIEKDNFQIIRNGIRTSRDLFAYLKKYLPFSLKYFCFQPEYNIGGGEGWRVYFESEHTRSLQFFKRIFLDSDVYPTLLRRDEAVRRNKSLVWRTSNLEDCLEGGSLSKNKGRVRINSKTFKEHISLNADNNDFSIIKKVFFKIRNKSYQTLEEAKNQLSHYLFIWQKRLEQEWKRRTTEEEEKNRFYHQVPVIWIKGKTGSGKTTLTQSILYKKGFLGEEILTIKPETSLNYNRILFPPSKTIIRALIIEECQPDFPKANNFASFTDRGTFLFSQEGKVKNNLEIILVNSVHLPEKIFNKDNCPENYSQILRRIYNTKLNCRVFSLQENNDLFSNIKTSLPSLEMIKTYAPQIKLTEKKRSYD